MGADGGPYFGIFVIMVSLTVKIKFGRRLIKARPNRRSMVGYIRQQAAGPLFCQACFWPASGWLIMKVGD